MNASSLGSNIPGSSTALKASKPSLDFNGPLTGVPPRSWDATAAVSEPVDDLSAGSEEFKALFHCLTSSTARSKVSGAFDTGASARRRPTIQACLSSFRADTRKFGSFWKHCMRKSLAAWRDQLAFVGQLRFRSQHDTNRRYALRQRRMVIVDNGKEGRHRGQIVIWRLPL